MRTGVLIHMHLAKLISVVTYVLVLITEVVLNKKGPNLLFLDIRLNPYSNILMRGRTASVFLVYWIDLHT